MMSTALELSWPNTLRNACSLWLKLRRGDDDKRLSTDTNTEIRYVTDVNVINLFADPAKNSKYALLLGLMDDDHVTLLSYILSHIFFFGHPGSPQKQQILIVPPHDEEIAIVYEAARKNALKEAEISVDEVAVALRTARDDHNLERILAILRKFPVLNVLFGDQFVGSVNELARWHDLFGRGRITHIEGERWYQEPHKRDIELCESRWRAKINKFFRDRAKRDIDRDRSKRHPRPEFRIERDTWVLARIESVNKQLDLEDSHIRLRFVTGDSVIQEVADDHFSRLPRSEHFVRDPRIFLDDLTDTLPFEDAEEPYGVREWLRVFLAPLVNRDGRIDDDRVSQFASAEASSDLLMPVAELFLTHHGEKRLHQAKLEWEEFVTRVGQGFGLKLKSPTKQAREIINAIGEDLDGVLRQLDCKVIDVLTDLSTTSAIAGLFLKKGVVKGVTGAGLESLERHRMPVAIRFLDTAFMGVCFQNLADAVAGKNLDAIELIPHEDKYAAHLVYALFFAASGDWRAASNLCCAANMLVDGAQADRKISKIEGHESAYLLAVTMRHLARSPKDMEDAKTALRRAENLWREEGHQAADPRFAAERSAQRLFEINFDFFRVGVEDCAPYATELLNIGRDLAALANEVQVKELIPAIRLPLLKQICTNALQCCILRRTKCNICDKVSSDYAMTSLTVLDNTMKELGETATLPHAKIFRSLFVNAVAEVARCLLMSKPTPEAIGKAQEALRRAEEVPQMPYDAERFRFLREFVDGLARA